MSEAGKCMLVKKSLYILKGSSASFRSHLAEILDAMGYKQRYADPDKYIQSVVKTN